MLGQEAGLVGGAVVASFSQEARAAPPGQLGHSLVANLVFGSEEGAVPFQERGGRKDSLERQPRLQALPKSGAGVLLGGGKPS